MLAKFQEHIENKFPELRQKKFLLACSGGLDSVVLARLCHRSALNFDIAHCNFNLRGTQSDGDEELVKTLAIELDSRVFVTHFDTIGYVKKNKVSIEMAARELRYAWFAEIMKKNTIETLVTAHHADDGLETFLINLSRGTGIQGLTGIPSKTSVIARPLLHFSKEEILTYAQNQNLNWREDSTNQDTVFLRNKVRHELVPKLKELHPSFLENFQKTQRYLTDSAQMVADYVVLLKSELFLEENGIIHIPIEKLAALHPRRTYLYELFNAYGFRAWDDIAALLEGMSGKEVRSRTHRLVRGRSHLLLEEITVEKEQNYLIPEGATGIDFPCKLNIEEVDTISETAENILYVDKSTLKYPMVVRKWKKGDYFYPLGMTGKKKLSKYFKDEKIDVISKEKQRLLCSDDDIVWIIGKRGDNRFKVTKDTKHILRFTWIT